MVDKPAASACPDCGAESTGRFCPECGQRLDADPRSVRYWLRTFFDETLSLDGRLPRTLKVLIRRPGFLTQEWRARRWSRWTAPFRVFLLCSIILFAVNLVAPEGFISLTVGVNQGTALELATSRQSAAEAARTYGPQVLFVLAPLFAVLLRIFFHKARHVYVEHLVHSFHLHALGFLSFSALFLAEFLPGPWDNWIQFGITLGLLAYLPLSAHRVYGLSWLGTVLRSTAVLYVYFFLSLIGFGVAALLARSTPFDALELAEARYWDVRERLASGDSSAARAIADNVIVDYQRLEAHLHTPLVRAHLAELLILEERAAEARVVAEGALVADPEHLLALSQAARAADARGAPGADVYWARYLNAYPRRAGDEGVAGPHGADLEAFRVEAEGRTRAGSPR